MTGLLKKIDELDRSVSSIIHKWSWGYFDILVFLPATAFGVMGIPFLVIWWYWQYNSPILFIAVIVVVAINESLKHFIHRERPLPEDLGEKWPNLRKIHNNPAMPSGDTAQAAVAAVTLVCHGFSFWFLLAIPVGAFGRIYYGSHWIGDCIVGALIGSILAITVNYYLYVPLDFS